MPVYVPLPTRVHDALRELAHQELRDPRLQARVLVEEGLRARGLLTAEPAAPMPPEDHGTAAAE